MPRLLDIGTGLGTMIEVAEKLGFESEGIEFCKGLAKKARERGFKVHSGKTEELHFDKKFEVITMMDVIEHLPNPLATLKSLKRFLIPGGEIIVYTPNHRSPIVRMANLLNTFGVSTPAVNIFANNHVSFFDDNTLSETLKRAGFHVKEKVIRPYDIFRPGGQISLISLIMVSLVEYLGYFMKGAGFRLLVYAELMP